MPFGATGSPPRRGCLQWPGSEAGDPLRAGCEKSSSGLATSQKSRISRDRETPAFTRAGRIAMNPRMVELNLLLGNGLQHQERNGS